VRKTAHLNSITPESQAFRIAPFFRTLIAPCMRNIHLCVHDFYAQLLMQSSIFRSTRYVAAVEQMHYAAVI